VNFDADASASWDVDEKWRHHYAARRSAANHDARMDLAAASAAAVVFYYDLRLPTRRHIHVTNIFVLCVTHA